MFSSSQQREGLSIALLAPLAEWRTPNNSVTARSWAQLTASVMAVVCADLVSTFCASCIWGHPTLTLNFARDIQVISADVKGFIKYWDSETFKFPSQGVNFKSVFQTDLMDCVKSGTTPKAIAVSRLGDRFAAACSDFRIRVFEYASGKLLRIFDASMQVRHRVSPQKHCEG